MAKEFFTESLAEEASLTWFATKFVIKSDSTQWRENNA